jgi:cysteine-rich repeat protein
MLALVKSLPRATIALLAVAAVPCAWGACSNDFDQFAPAQTSGTGSGVTTTTSGSAGGGGSAATTSSGGGQGGTSATGGGSAVGGAGGAGGTGGVLQPACGDGDVDPGEDCDDGGTVPADGCSATCTLENADACPGPSIMLTTAGFTVMGDTTGVNNDTGGAPCGGGNSGELVYQITPAQDGTMVATMDGMFSTHLYTRAECPGMNNNDIECSTVHMPATITQQVTAGQAFYLFVDGYGLQAEEGPFTLTLQLN